MVSAKGILTHLVLLCVIGWMFVLGVIVGRGQSPITFDTQKFEKRLEAIAGTHSEKTSSDEIKFDFYKTLDEPLSRERIVSKPAPEKRIIKQAVKKPPIPDIPDTPAEPETASPNALTPDKTTESQVPVKISLKKKTLKSRNQTTPEPGAVTEARQTEASRSYTIQVASYLDIKDAENHVTTLEKQGVSARHTQWEKDGKIWYRVRTGFFSTRDEARNYLEKLKQKKIDGIILEHNP